jgi:hypothetical protein
MPSRPTNANVAIRRATKQIGIAVLGGHQGPKYKFGRKSQWSKGVGSFEAAKRIRPRPPDEIVPLRTGHGSDQKDYSLSRQWAGNPSGEVNAMTGGGPMRAQMQRRVGANLQIEGRHCPLQPPVTGDPDRPRRTAGQLEEPTTVFVRRRGSGKGVSPAGGPCAFLDADDGSGGVVPSRVHQTAADQGSAAVGQRAIRLVGAGETSAEPGAIAHRRVRARSTGAFIRRRTVDRATRRGILSQWRNKEQQRNCWQPKGCN